MQRYTNFYLFYVFRFQQTFNCRYVIISSNVKICGFTVSLQCPIVISLRQLEQEDCIFSKIVLFSGDRFMLYVNIDKISVLHRFSLILSFIFILVVGPFLVRIHAALALRSLFSALQLPLFFNVIMCPRILALSLVSIFLQGSGRCPIVFFISF